MIELSVDPPTVMTLAASALCRSGYNRCSCVVLYVSGNGYNRYGILRTWVHLD